MKSPRIFPLLAKPISRLMSAPFPVVLLILVFALVFYSCDKTHQGVPAVKEVSAAGQRLLAAVEQYKKQIMATPVRPAAKMGNAKTETLTGTSDDEVTYYIQFPTIPSANLLNLYNNASTIQDVVNLREQGQAVIQFNANASSSNYPITLSKQTAKTSLQPLIAESRTYLHSKGLTDADINDMIYSQGGTEEDLVPFTLSLVQIEKTPKPFINYPDGYTFHNEHGYINGRLTKLVNRLTGDTTWYVIGQQDPGYEVLTVAAIGTCAMEAIGADIFWALAQSSASAWTMAAITTAFRTVAKKVIGPIGVAIAVGEFSWCLYQHS